MKKIVLFVWIIFSFLPLEADVLSKQISAGIRNFLSIRVEFREDNTDFTTGNGKFMFNEWTDHDTSYVLDPLPHDRDYFLSHLTFIDNYWKKASDGRIGINTDNAFLIPSGDRSYTLSKAMRYYSDPDSLDYRLALLVYESVMLAVDSGDYINNNDGIIIYHAGVGQDFNIDLDDTPFDIPSFYFDEDYLMEYLPENKFSDLSIVNALNGVVLPESQNQLKINIALNGTEILLTGMLLGLPTLYDTEFGRSGAGIYGLMDQGSNTGSGLCPIKPSAFERYLLGSAEPAILRTTQDVTLLRDEVYKLPVSSNEYFLVEFRKNAGLWADSLLSVRKDIKNYLDVLGVMDSLDLVDYTLENGVLTDLSDLDLGLPTNGILIWHIVEPEFFGENPNAQNNGFLDLVEADGGDDIGKFYGALNPTVNNGWKWDMWFTNNPAYEKNNPSSYKIQFSDATHPNSRSNEGLPTGISIRDFKFYADSAVIQLVIDSPSAYNFDGMVFDEMSTSVPADLTSGAYLVGYRDSSLYVFTGDSLREVYHRDSAYVKGNTALLSRDRDLIQVTRSNSSSDVAILSYGGGALSKSGSMRIDYPIDLERLAIHNDSLFIAPLPADISHDVYMLDLSSWTLQTLTASNTLPFIPYRCNDRINHVNSRAAALMNETLIYADTYGFIVDPGLAFTHDAEQLPPVYADQYKISELLPAYLDEHAGFDILAIAEYEGKTVLAAFNQYGSLLNGFPVFKNYSKIGVYKLDDEPLIAAYDPAGVIDIYDTDAIKRQAIPAPVNAASFFIEQINSDTAWIVADGCIYAIGSDEVLWGYPGKDAVYSNAGTETQSVSPLASDKLIYQDLIYNYPNPIEGELTKFRFFSTGATDIRIDIYALNGQFVQTLEQPVIDQQWNEVDWNVSNVGSGVYIAKIEISDNTKTETYFVKPAILK